MQVKSWILSFAGSQPSHKSEPWLGSALKNIRRTQRLWSFICTQPWHLCMETHRSTGTCTDPAAKTSMGMSAHWQLARKPYPLLSTPSRTKHSQWAVRNHLYHSNSHRFVFIQCQHYPLSQEGWIPSSGEFPAPFSNGQGIAKACKRHPQRNWGQVPNKKCTFLKVPVPKTGSVVIMAGFVLSFPYITAGINEVITVLQK